MNQGDAVATAGGSAGQQVSGPTVDLMAVLGECYAATLERDPWPRILAAIAPCFGTGMGMVIGVDRIYPSQSLTETTGIAPQFAAAMRRRDLDHDHVWRAVLPLPAGFVYRSTDLVPVDVLRQGPLWDEMGDPAGFDFALGAIIENTPSYFWTVVVLRPDHDFSAAEKALMTRLVPHLQTVLRLARRIELGDAGRREALLSFERANQPVVVLDRSGYAIYANGAARRILGQADGVSLKFGRFLFQSVSVQGEFERALRLALLSLGKDIVPVPHVVRVPRRGPGSPYAVSVIPLTSSSDRAALPDGAGCMVLVYDPEQPNPLPVDRLAMLYRLTRAEARVCEAIFRKGSVDATAEELSLTRNTVRSHLKSLYSKFGVTSQGQFMQRLASSLRLGTAVATDRGTG